MPTTAALTNFTHYPGWVEDRFCGLTPTGRVTVISRNVYPIDGQPTWTGQIYLMNDDGTKQVLMNPNLRAYNKLCLGATDSWIIVGRYPFDIDALRTAPTSLWGYPTSGSSQAIQLVKAATHVTLSFQGITMQGRVLFQTNDSSSQTQTNYSIEPDGSGLVTLVSSQGEFRQLCQRVHRLCQRALLDAKPTIRSRYRAGVRE